MNKETYKEITRLIRIERQLKDAIENTYSYSVSKTLEAEYRRINHAIRQLGGRRYETHTMAYAIECDALRLRYRGIVIDIRDYNHGPLIKHLCNKQYSRGYRLSLWQNIIDEHISLYAR